MLLLGIPKEERAQFILDMDIEGMINQELRKAVNERTQTRQEKDQALQEKDQALQEKDQAPQPLVFERASIPSRPRSFLGLTLFNKFRGMYY